MQHAWNALLWACNEGHDEIVQLLLEHNAKVGERCVSYDFAADLCLSSKK